MRALASLLLLALGCGSASRPAPPSEPSADPPPPRSEDLYSEPVEYRVRPVSAEVGREHFVELGMGDPYGAGIAYPVFLGLRAGWPEALGEDWRAFDARYGTFTAPEQDDDPQALPVGFHLTNDPYTRVDFLVMSCALCHADRIRLPDGERVVVGMGNPRLRIHAYDRALTRLALDPALEEGRLLRLATEQARAHGLRWPAEARRPVVRESIRRLRELARKRRAGVEHVGDGLPGRVATIEGFAIALNARHGTRIPLAEHVGWAKIPDVAPYRWRDTIAFDAATVGSPVALVAEGDFVFGVRPEWLESHRHIATSMHLYLRGFERELDYPGEIDRAQAERGRLAFEESCSGCHGSYGELGAGWNRVSYRERVVPGDIIGTDTARLESITEEFVEAANAFPWSEGLAHVRRTEGWVPRPLVDAWARGLYGHAGQWPDLAVLATPPAERPTRFVVEATAPFDWERVGSRWRAVEPGAEPELAPGEYLYDASEPGFGVQGHPFLSDLEPPSRAAVIEYLKTL